jgi:hypothetical protein
MLTRGRRRCSEAAANADVAVAAVAVVAAAIAGCFVVVVDDTDGV